MHVCAKHGLHKILRSLHTVCYVNSWCINNPHVKYSDLQLVIDAYNPHLHQALMFLSLFIWPRCVLSQTNLKTAAKPMFLGNLSVQSCNNVCVPIKSVGIDQ